MKLLITFYWLIFCTICFAQTNNIQGYWKLETMSRANGAIMFYDGATDRADGYPPVYWKFSADKMAITGDLSALATSPTAQDTVEAHTYRIAGDTLLLTQYYTKGLELATITNAPKAFYKIDKVDGNTLQLLLYDRKYDGSFRTMDMYSRRYVFTKTEPIFLTCSGQLFERFKNQPVPKDTMAHFAKFISAVDSCLNLNANDTLNTFMGLSHKAQYYFESKNYKPASECLFKLITLMEAYMKPRGGEKTNGRVPSELYFELGYSQVMIGQQAEGCLNMQKAIKIYSNDSYQKELDRLCK